MRVHRLTLRDYRGVRSCELTFAERGVTVVEGDNEVGKSSAAEALHLLFEFRDDSTHKDVKAVKPLHRDAGAEVEADVTVGPHRLTFAKRWHRDRYTRLKVVAPVPQVLTGREAHDRVRALLAETVDLELWRALSVRQAEGLERASLRDHPSLVAALDAAADGALGTAEASDLLDRVAAEAGRWTTPLGRPRAELLEVRRRAADAATEVAACEQALASLEADVTWCADLQRSAEEMERKLARAASAVELATARRDEVRSGHEAVERLAVAAELARSEAALAAAAVTAREGLTARVEAAYGALRTAEAAARHAAGTVAEAEAEEARTDAVAGAAHVALDEAAVAAEGAAEAHATAREAATLAGVERELARLETVLVDAARLESELEASTAALAACRTDPTSLAGVQQAHDDVVRAEAALAAGQATVRLEAVTGVEVLVDGRRAELPAGAVLERGVDDRLEVELPGRVRLTVVAGAGAAELAAQLGAARATLAGRCAALGVSDLAGARDVEVERRRLVSEVTSLRAALDAAVAGTTVAAISAVADEARALVATAPARIGDAPSADEVDRLRERWDEARDGRRAAERAADRADAAVVAARTATASAAAATARAAAGVGAAAAAHAAMQAELADARAHAPDDALVATADAARRAATAATATWQEAAAAHGAEVLAATEQELQRTRAEHRGLASSLARRGEELASIRSRLDVQGEAGLHDRLAEARRRAAATAAEQEAVEARATAARLLLTTLTRHRDEVARAYGAPLRARLESLGRLVFGPTFGVELDDQLRVAARVVDGVPVPWSELSVGAKEQLAVLSRLAAATLVSDDGGVPVVFDDVLGFSDPGRVALVSAAFEAAAEQCQIIVLTCDPSRYRHLARATTHCLTAPREVSTRQAG